MKISTWPRHMFSSTKSKLLSMAALTIFLGSCALIPYILVAIITVSTAECVVGNNSGACGLALSDLALEIGGPVGKVYPIIAAGIKTLLDPPAADLAYFNASQASAAINISNLSLTSIGGTATISITDDSTGTVLGSQGFPFTISGDVARFSDPSAVDQWVHAFSSYPGNVSINTQFYVATSVPAPGQTGSIQITTQYGGSPYLSGSAAVSGPPICDGKPSPVKCAP